MPLLNDAEITERMKTVPHWTRDGHRIRRQFDCASFPDAMAFLLRVGFDAEAADHARGETAGQQHEEAEPAPTGTADIGLIHFEPPINGKRGRPEASRALN